MKHVIYFRGPLGVPSWTCPNYKLFFTMQDQLNQPAKKVVFSSSRLMDFAVRLVNPIL